MSGSSPDSPAAVEWFAHAEPNSGRPDPGLRFSCTMCGNCCSGPEGYVLVTDDEAAAMARRLNLPIDDFLSQYTHRTREGRSLKERKTEHGLDCILLDRTTRPGKALCSVYEDRPAQCRTWPFWPSVVRSRQTWDRAAAKTCPGMNKGPLHSPVQIRVLRDSFDI